MFLFDLDLDPWIPSDCVFSPPMPFDAHGCPSAVDSEACDWTNRPLASQAWVGDGMHVYWPSQAWRNIRSLTTG